MSEDRLNATNPDPKPDLHLKGGGLRGGPRRWTGAGPRPARHVPWPELFKHHESNLTGHLKMMDMVRKHCVEGTGNWQTAQACVDRTRKMLSDFREVKRNFVPPRDEIHRVPLGASSASVYPGYSPADHIYGEAAQEYGQQITEAKKQGLEFKLDPSGPEYVVGQSAKDKKEQMTTVDEQVRSWNGQNPGGHGEEDGVLGDANTLESNLEPASSAEQQPPMFFIDSNPTPVALNGSVDGQKHGNGDKHSKKIKKRKQDQVVDSDAQAVSAVNEPKAKKAKNSPVAEPFATAAGEESKKREKKEKKVKKEKQKRAEEISGGDAAVQAAQLQVKKIKISHEPIIEEDDIEAEVEARLREKEEKRKRRKEKKRKRESEGSALLTPTEAEESAQAEKPKKKAKKADLEKSEGQETVNRDQHSISAEKRKKIANGDKIANNGNGEEEGAKKKRKTKPSLE